jgi:hypothetical protein
VRRTTIVPTCALLLALSACGGGSKGSAAPVGGSDPSALAASLATAASAGTSSSDSTSSGSVNVCSLLPTSYVSRITGTRYTSTKPSSTMGQIFECEYSNAQYALLQVSLTTANGSIAYDGDVQAMSSLEKPLTVSGVGDKAFAAPDPKGNAGSAGVAAFASYGVLFGDQYIKIGGSYVTPDQGKQIADEIHGKL